MQVRDLIELLKCYPKDFPVAYLTKAGNALPISVKLSEGCISRDGYSASPARDCIQPFLGFYITPKTKYIDPKSYTKRKDVVPKEVKPKVGQLWQYTESTPACAVRLNSEMHPNGTYTYYGITAFGRLSSKDNTLETLIAQHKLTYISD